MTSIGLVELPALKLVDEQGRNWTAFRSKDPMGSKQILAAQLEDAGFRVDIVDLRAGSHELPLGSVEWNGLVLTEICVGRPWLELDPDAHDLWGVTVNYLQERRVACLVIEHLSGGPAPVVVGGSDALAEPHLYRDAGADAVVLDKSGRSNVALVRSLSPSSGAPGDRDQIAGVALADGRVRPKARPPMSPQEWPLPSPAVVAETLGESYWEAPIPESLLPIGSVMLDLGCDRHCDFCQTPTYGVGYRAMTPARAAQWIHAQADVGARSIIVLSDQFLGRVLRPDGAAEVAEIMSFFRSRNLAVLWGNGLELSKATLGRGLPDGDPTPDLELVDHLWGWDGSTGCAQAYIPAERPTQGPASYRKLLPWQSHTEMLEAIVSAGVPDLNYGVIVGLPEDSPPDLEFLCARILELKQRLKKVNPALRFRITPYAIRPLPGTALSAELRAEGLLRFEEPSISGGFWTACADTRMMNYREVSRWQEILINDIGDRPESDWQGLTGFVRATTPKH